MEPNKSHVLLMNNQKGHTAKQDEYEVDLWDYFVMEYFGLLSLSRRRRGSPENGTDSFLSDFDYHKAGFHR